MKFYIAKDSKGNLRPRTLSYDRSGVVWSVTGSWISEKCAAWKNYHASGWRIVRVEVKEL